ncbi:MAG: GNAT family N-acetyltransferase, partial [Anaerolineae bacterium]
VPLTPTTVKLCGDQDELVILRRLRAEDVPALVAFYNGLSDASKRTFRPIEEHTTPEVCAGIVVENLERPPVKFDVVALLGDKVIGWSFIWDLASEEPVFGLAVADPYHGRGLGTALMTRVLAWARSRPLPTVFLTVVQDNHVAKRLYEKQGFVKYGEFVGEDGLPYDRMRIDLVANPAIGVMNRDSFGP